MPLNAALAKLEAGDVSSAVPLLLEAWRKTPDVRLAEVLDGLSTRINRPPLPSASQKKTTEAFLELVTKKDPLDLPRLVAVIGTTRSAQMVEQLEAMLEQWPADPRVTRPFLLLLKNPPFTGSSTQSAWRRLFKLLQQYADPRVIAELGALDFAQLFREKNNFNPQGVDENAYAASFFAERAAAAIATLQKKYPKGLPARPPPDDVTLKRLLELAKPSAEAALLAEVHAAPQKAGAREVLADHLIEKNDVRGQFMALQQARAQGALTPAMAKEERQLLEQYGMQWAGALAPLLRDECLRFERGLLAECTIDGDRLGLVKELTGNPLWSTVQRVHLYGHNFPRELLVDPAMKSLLGVTGITDRVARGLLGGGEVYSWKSVGLHLPHYDSVASDTTLLAKNLKRVFPSLEELDVSAYSIEPAQHAWLWTPEFAHLKRIGFNGAGSLSKWVAQFERAPKQTVLELRHHHGRGFELRLLPGGVLEVASRPVQGFTTVTLAELAKGAAPLEGKLTKVRILTRSTKADRALFEALLAKGGTVELSAP